MEVLEASEEKLDRKYRLQAQGYDLEKIARRVASLFEIEPENIYAPGKHRRIVQDRSLFCYWAVRELGAGATVLARKLKISQSAGESSQGKRIWTVGGIDVFYNFMDVPLLPICFLVFTLSESNRPSIKI